jgi:hypothetical protein
MNRTRWAENCCPVCKEVPTEKDGLFICACDKPTWRFVHAEKGTAGEESRLGENGFQFAQDARGDAYYVGPLGHIVHLYPDGGWNSDKSPADLQLN